LSGNDYKLYGKDVKKLVENAKLAGLVPEKANYLASGIVPDNEHEWMKIIEHYGSDLKDIDIGTRIAKETLYASIQDKNTIDFNDMLYMPIIYNATFSQNDFLFIDEAQDTSGCLLLGCSVISVSFIICMLTLLLMLLTGLHFCVGLM
jgi:superfamily I DNA/RNA helicase